MTSYNTLLNDAVALLTFTNCYAEHILHQRSAIMWLQEWHPSLSSFKNSVSVHCKLLTWDTALFSTLHFSKCSVMLAPLLKSSVSVSYILLTCGIALLTTLHFSKCSTPHYEFPEKLETTVVSLLVVCCLWSLSMKINFTFLLKTKNKQTNKHHKVII